MWESNPPKQLFTTITGFEDQGAHQHPSTPIYSGCFAYVLIFYHKYTQEATVFSQKRENKQKIGEVRQKIHHGWDANLFHCQRSAERSISFTKASLPSQ